MLVVFASKSYVFITEVIEVTDNAAIMQVQTSMGIINGKYLANIM